MTSVSKAAPQGWHEAVALHRGGQLAQALSAYERIIADHPRHAEAHFNRGVILQDLNRLDEALSAYEHAIVLHPAFIDTHYNRGVVLQQLNRPAEALAGYDSLVALKPDHAPGHYNRGVTLQALNRLEEALAAYERATAISSGFFAAHYNHGVVLQDLGRPEAALASFDQAVTLAPDHAPTHRSRGLALHQLGRQEEALVSYDRAIALNPRYAKAHRGRGDALMKLSRWEDALLAYDRAIVHEPNYVEVYSNRGYVLEWLGRRDEAMACYDRAIALKPNHARAHFNKGLLKLKTGHLDEGWKLNEWRWLGLQMGTARNFPQALWLGEESVAGKTILIHPEQGLGDFILACRYIPLLEDIGAKVVLETPAPLMRLMATLTGEAALVEVGRPLPPFDLHCPIMSLPLAFKTSLATIPASIPYLRWEEAKAAEWARRLGPKTKRRVGLVWKTGFHPNQPETRDTNERRDIRLHAIGRLNLPEIDFYSLQKGEPAESELARLRNEVWPETNLHIHGGELKDFADTAALIANLDLVISVDTSTAHLAGALGKPVWILLNPNACWRWLLDRTDSPWYSTVRLYRQRQSGDWNEVIARAKADLRSEFG